MTKRILLVVLIALPSLALIGWGGFEIYRLGSAAPKLTLPSTRVKRGDVTIGVTARGELQGSKSETLTAPATGGREMVITFLRKQGELVEAGERVVQFDTTEQDFNLREAEADLAEAEQQVIQAHAENEAREEEARYALIHAKAVVDLAELEVRKNPLLAAITAKQNLLALEAAHDRQRQLQQDIANREATAKASVAIQEAARNKAKVKADVARRNIESMTLKAKSRGYVSVNQNTFSGFMFWGMQLPTLQIGDTVRAGMPVAQIPDVESWEATAKIGELDRGHLAEGQKADITVAALPGKSFTGQVKNIGGVTGPPWDRNFECKVALNNPSPDLRAGMSARIVITTGHLPNVLWVPSQALFESDGRTFVYLRSESGFQPKDVKLVRRSESQVALTGLTEGQTVALASPDQFHDKAKKGPAGVMKAIPKS